MTLFSPIITERLEPQQLLRLEQLQLERLLQLLGLLLEQLLLPLRHMLLEQERLDRLRLRSSFVSPRFK
jgi:hypothetical protein